MSIVTTVYRNAKQRAKRAKLRFGVIDIYKAAATGETSKVKGIVSYEVNKDATVMVVMYEDPTGEYPAGLARNYFMNNEFDVYATVSMINKRIKAGARGSIV